MDKTSSDVYATLSEHMTYGKQVALSLRGGQVVGSFRTHDVIVPTALEARVDMSQALVRGVVCPDTGEWMDRSVNLSDIETVRHESALFRYSAEPGFSTRNPIPEGWVRVGTCPREPRPLR